MVEQSGASRLAAVAGVAGVLLPLASLPVEPIWSFPSTDVSDAALVRFVEVHHAALQVTMALDTAGVTLWLVFGAALAVHLRARVPHTEGALALIACLIAGFCVFVALLLAGFTMFDVVVYRVPRPGDARLLYDVTFALLAMSGMPTAVALGSYGVLVRRHPVLPRWTAVLALVAAVAHLALPASFVVRGGFLSLEGEVITVIPGLLFAWILATGAALWRSGRPTGAPAPGSAAAGRSADGDSRP